MEDSKPVPTSPATPLGISAVTLKLPVFWAAQPKVWFAQAEAQFVLRGISVDDTKYYHLLAALDQDTAKRVADLIYNPPDLNKYESLKTRLLATFMQSPYRMAQKLLDMAPLGDRTPSQMMDDMLGLLGTHEPCILFRTLFVDALPQDVRSHLIPNLETFSPRELALLADRLVNSNSSSISTLATKNPTPREWSSNSKGLCRFHKKWGSKAFRCISPCTYEQQPKSKVFNVQGNYEVDLQ